MQELHRTQMGGTNPAHAQFDCGACGKSTNGRVIGAMLRRADGVELSWCMCSCERQEPTIIVQKDGAVITQIPQPKKFHASPEWPTDLANLYEEAARSFSAGAFTSASMVCRKILMACACHEQDKANQPVKEGESFAYYVDYLAQNILNFSAAKAPIDVIRKIGNDANHHVQFVNLTDAERSMKIVHYMLDTIYSFPAA